MQPNKWNSLAKTYNPLPVVSVQFRDGGPFVISVPGSFPLLQTRLEIKEKETEMGVSQFQETGRYSVAPSSQCLESNQYNQHNVYY